MSHVATSHRPKKHEEEEHENHERWAVSYADMMTVLLALFIVLYAISVVDKTKFEQLRTSLAVGFGAQTFASPIQGSTGPLNGVESFQIAPDFTGVSGDTAQMLNPEAQLNQDATTFLEAAKEYEQLSDIQTNMQDHLQAQGLDANVTFLVDERGLVIGLVGSDVFFAPDDAALTPVAQHVVDTLAEPIRSQARQVSIDGYADVTPSQRYPTNWELSSARATQVLRRFVEAGNVSGAQISATGYGDARPIAEGTSSAALAQNRRVDIVIRSSASEDVRALLPRIAEALANGTLTEADIQAEIDAANAASGAATSTDTAATDTHTTEAGH